MKLGRACELHARPGATEYHTGAFVVHVESQRVADSWPFSMLSNNHCECQSYRTVRS
jgi:hypothetical protein